MHDSIQLSLFSLWRPISRFDAYTSASQPNTYLLPHIMPNHPWHIIRPMRTILFILIYSLHMTPSYWVILYLLLLIADITENPSELIYHSYWLLVYSISTCTPIRLLIDSSLADNHSVVLPIVPYSSHWTIATFYLQAHSHLLYIYKHMYIHQRWSAFELVKSPSQLWISPNFNSPVKVFPSQLGDLYHLLCF